MIQSKLWELNILVSLIVIVTEYEGSQTHRGRPKNIKHILLFTVHCIHTFREGSQQPIREAPRAADGAAKQRQTL